MTGSWEKDKENKAMIYDEVMKSRKRLTIVIPAKAGIQCFSVPPLAEVLSQE